MDEVLRELARRASEALRFALGEGAAVVLEIPPEPTVEELMERELPQRGADLRNAFKDGLIYLLREERKGVLVYLADEWGRREERSFLSWESALEWLWKERGARLFDDWQRLISERENK